jgi:TldD protein
MADTHRNIQMSSRLFLLCLPATVLVALSSANAQTASPLMDAMSTELHRAMTDLAAPAAGAKPEDRQPPYYMSYAAHDRYAVAIAAQQGALLGSDVQHTRQADIVVRVGESSLDNTHSDHRASAVHTVSLPLTEDQSAIERSLWWATNTEYRNALQTYLRVKTEQQVRAKEEDTSPDFSQEKPVTANGTPVTPPHIDTEAWNNRIKALSAVFRNYPHIYANFVILSVDDETSYFLSSEGTQVVAPHRLSRVVAVAVTRADDGMDMFRAATFESSKNYAPHRWRSRSAVRPFFPDAPPLSSFMRCLGTGSKASASAAIRKARPSLRTSASPFCRTLCRSRMTPRSRHFRAHG